ncbi:MAG: beta-glucosidase [Acidimicrobiales bacterium]
MTADVATLVAAMTLDEKAALTAGADNWSTFGVPRLGVPGVVLSDGPVGARGATVDHESATTSIAIPSGTALGASFDPALVARLSAIVARQALDKGARVLLAPTVNLHRHPLWGRNFEGFSEDPLLSAKLAVAYIQGVQGEGVAATVKHFVGNEAEHERFTCSTDVDERTLRECYLVPFEHAVRHGHVMCVMTAYNRVNGEHVPDQDRLLRQILRGEWGFDGLVMSDWWAMLRTDDAARAGLDLEMPGPARSFGPALAAAVRAGRVAEADLDAKIRRLLALLDGLGLLDGARAVPTDDDSKGGIEGLGVVPRPEEHPQDRAEDRAALRRAAADCTVLLRNDGLLPLDPGALRRVALLGARSEHPSIMGGGSAKVRPHYQLSLLELLRERLGPGVEVLHEAATDETGVAAAASAASEADLAIVVVGTDEAIESEGYDRTTMDLPGTQDALVRAVTAANPRTVVVVTSGAPVTMSWASETAALIQSFFSGQETASALLDVLVGDAEPGGRLPTTLPLRLEHTPAFGNFPGEASHVRYGEGLLVGYRWYEARHLPVAFPFGHGLSYTSFEIGRPTLSSDHLGAGERVRVEVPVTNSGARRGAEVVQCYVAPPGGGTAAPGARFRPVKELRGFAKVWLDPGASTVVSFDLGERSFAHYDAADEDWAELVPRRPHEVYPPPPPSAHRTASGWYVAPGTYELVIGRSSADIAHRVSVTVDGGDVPLDPAMLPD